MRIFCLILEISFTSRILGIGYAWVRKHRFSTIMFIFMDKKLTQTNLVRELFTNQVSCFTILKQSVNYVSKAAAVGDTKHSKFAEDEPPLFPHIYGGINPDAVVKKLNVIRSLDGSFDAIDGLVSAIGSATIS